MMGIAQERVPPTLPLATYTHQVAVTQFKIEAREAARLISCEVAYFAEARSPVAGLAPVPA